MRVRAIALAITVLAVWGLAVSGVGAQSKASTDETAVRDVIRKYVDAREKRDAKGIEALFTADADQLTSSGDWRKGRPDIVKGTLASSQSSGGTRTITIESVRLVAPNVAIADGRYEIAGLSNGTTRS